MKKFIIVLILGLSIYGVSRSEIWPNCSKCYETPPWEYYSPDFTVYTQGDCFSGPQFCGTAVQCVTGINYCHPHICHTEFNGCQILFP